MPPGGGRQTLSRVRAAWQKRGSDRQSDGSGRESFDQRTPAGTVRQPHTKPSRPGGPAPDGIKTRARRPWRGVVVGSDTSHYGQFT